MEEQPHYQSILSNITKLPEFALERLENFMGKGENAAKPAFSPFPIMFSKVVFPSFVKKLEFLENGFISMRVSHWQMFQHAIWGFYLAFLLPVSDYLDFALRHLYWKTLFNVLIK